MNTRFIITGILFAFLWGSAATATRIGLQSAQPFTVSLIRFGIAGTGMLLVSGLLMKSRLPRGREWKALAIYGLLNITIYLGLYVIAMQTTAAGIASLAIAMNPVLISMLAIVFLRYRFTPISLVSLVLCTSGVVIAAWPLLKNSYATPSGLAILGTSMVAYSAGALYYTRQNWGGLDILSINGWQTLLGGIFLLPFAIWFFEPGANHFDMKFWVGTLWLAIPVSIGAMQLWMHLLRKNTVAAAYFLYLCPVFGFLLAALILKEPLSFFTAAGLVLVITGLYLAQRNNIKSSG